MTTTPLDDAHAGMETDDAARLKFYEVLADSELFLLLEGEAQGDEITPQAIEVEGQAYVLAFDGEERLAEFTGGESDFAAVSGRALAGVLRGQGVGLGLNLNVAPSAILLPPEALAWLSEMLDTAPEQEESPVEEVIRPSLGGGVILALSARLARAGGLASHAWLVGARFGDGREGHLLAIVGAVAGAEAAIAKSVSEALSFSGAEDEALDVTFLPEGSPVEGQLARLGMRFDLPEPEPAEEVQIPGAAPGTDPSKPPKLK